MDKKERLKPFALFAASAAMAGSFLFGFQTGIISGALSFITDHFHLTLAQQSFLVSATLFAAFIGVMCSGALADAQGRKKTLIFSSLLFCLGTLLAARAPSYTSLLAGRSFVGLAVGIVSMTTPLYLAEISTTHLRGRIVAMHQQLVTVGILIAYLVNHHFDPMGLWRSMFYVGLIPAFAQVLALPFITESPSWLLSKGKTDAAFHVYTKLRSDKVWEESLLSLSSFVKQDERKGKLNLFSSAKVRSVLVIGILLNMFQQITGINTIIYYAPSILTEAGLDGSGIASYAVIGIGAVNVIATFFSVTLIEKLGRRSLLLIGVTGMFIAMQLLAIVMLFGASIAPFISALSLMAFVAFFAIGIGPVTMVLVSELYPMKIRGKAMSIATCSNWLFNYMMSLVFLSLLRFLGIAGVFQLYAVLSIFTILFIYFYVPETKGKSLEEIEASLH